VIPLAYYFFLLPQQSSISNQDEDSGTELPEAPSAEYIPLPTGEDKGTANGYRCSQTVALSATDKWRLVKAYDTQVYSSPM